MEKELLWLASWIRAVAEMRYMGIKEDPRDKTMLAIAERIELIVARHRGE